MDNAVGRHHKTFPQLCFLLTSLVDKQDEVYQFCFYPLDTNLGDKYCQLNASRFLQENKSVGGLESTKSTVLISVRSSKGKKHIVIQTSLAENDYKLEGHVMHVSTRAQFHKTVYW